MLKITTTSSVLAMHACTCAEHGGESSSGWRAMMFHVNRPARVPRPPLDMAAAEARLESGDPRWYCCTAHRVGNNYLLCGRKQVTAERVSHVVEVALSMYCLLSGNHEDALCGFERCLYVPRPRQCRLACAELHKRVRFAASSLAARAHPSARSQCALRAVTMASSLHGWAKLVLPHLYLHVHHRPLHRLRGLGVSLRISCPLHAACAMPVHVCGSTPCTPHASSAM
jgi:hypothetical protein